MKHTPNMTTEQGKRKPPPASNALTSRLSSSSPSSPRRKTSPQVKSDQTAGTKQSRQSGRISYDNIPKVQHAGRPLEAAAILNDPRLKQVTGVHPRKLSSYSGLQPSRDELMRLQWVMNLPDPYPVKRPKGNF
ncbi:hypothetical protein M434DRAFT_122708 [Hypoxylon sp. CO27-5]|nr:hypothetical protein M434DRAFT_122708 [Hypoxylon sp. CO27-5]